VDTIICASRNIYAAMIAPDNNNRARCIHIPVPFELPTGSHRKPHCVSGLSPYICHVGELKEDKGTPELVEAFQQTLSDEFSLVLVGSDSMNEQLREVVARHEKIFYLGPRGHLETLQIIANAALIAHPSKLEGMARCCLEAIALQKQALLPPGVPEFDEECPGFVVDEIEPRAISKKIKAILDSGDIPNFPLRTHDPDYVAGLTLAAYENSSGQGAGEGIDHEPLARR
jgi:glycosyltransferase involved in cell wall biosynthesis